MYSYPSLHAGRKQSMIGFRDELDPGKVRQSAISLGHKYTDTNALSSFHPSFPTQLT